MSACGMLYPILRLLISRGARIDIHICVGFCVVRFDWLGSEGLDASANGEYRFPRFFMPANRRWLTLSTI